MNPDERLDGPASRWGARLAEEVMALVVLSDPELVEFGRMLDLKRGCRR